MVDKQRFIFSDNWNNHYTSTSNIDNNNLLQSSFSSKLQIVANFIGKELFRRHQYAIGLLDKMLWDGKLS